MQIKTHQMIKRLFLNDGFILQLIIASCLLIFASGLVGSKSLQYWIDLADVIIISLFIIEAAIKINTYGLRGYFSEGWNRFDFAIVLVSLPALIIFVLGLDAASVGFLPIFRVFRIFRSFRLFRFVPGVDQLLLGIIRALKTSVIALVGFLIYIFVVAVMSYNFFHEVSPEHFGNTGIALYSTFKTFSIEGWFEIPEEIVDGQGALFTFLTYAYFVFVVITGGMFGLSLVNSIFVDAMVADNNDELLGRVDDLEKKLDTIIENTKK
jgi:voltage-gated sodium channel